MTTVMKRERVYSVITVDYCLILQYNKKVEFIGVSDKQTEEIDP